MNVAPLALAACLAQANASPQVLTLSEALQEAQSKNRDLKVAKARLGQAQLLHRKVWAHYLPRVELTAGYTHNTEENATEVPTGYAIRTIGTSSMNGGAFDPAKPVSTSNLPGTPSNEIIFPTGTQKYFFMKKDQVGAKLTLNQPLIVPELWPAFHEARLGEEIAENTVEHVRRELLFGVAQIYYGAASLKEAIAVQQRLLENNRTHERDAEAKMKAGAMPKIGLLRAQIDRTKSEQDLLRAENAYASAKSALATLLDREPDFEVVRPEEPALPEIPDREASALANRPDMKAARGSRELAERTLRAMAYQYAPKVGLIAELQAGNVKAFAPEYAMGSVTLGLQWTFWDGGKREIERREKELKLVESEAALGASAQKARDEVRRASLDLASARANRVKAEEQLRLARENNQLVHQNYAAGVASHIDASDAATALGNAEVGFVAESLNAQLAALRLLRAMGAFDPR
jgi:multidrug efflux system outer membrane protein